MSSSRFFILLTLFIIGVVVAGQEIFSRVPGWLKRFDYPIGASKRGMGCKGGI
jgi:hypothetical protein